MILLLINKCASLYCAFSFFTAAAVNSPDKQPPSALDLRPLSTIATAKRASSLPPALTTQPEPPPQAYGVLSSEVPPVSAPCPVARGLKTRASAPAFTSLATTSTNKPVEAAQVDPGAANSKLPAPGLHYAVPASPARKSSDTAPSAGGGEVTDEDTHFSRVQQSAEEQLAAMLNDLEILQPRRSQRADSKATSVSSDSLETSSRAVDVFSAMTNIDVPTAVDHSTPLASPVGKTQPLPQNQEEQRHSLPRPDDDVEVVLADLSGLSLGGSLPRRRTAGSIDEDADEWEKVVSMTYMHSSHEGVGEHQRTARSG